MTTSAHKRLFADLPDHLAVAARAIVDGEVLAHPFGNIYAFTTRPEPATIARVNIMKGMPAGRSGSIVTTRQHMADLFDWSKLPAGLSRERMTGLMDDCLGRGPLGFRGPAARHIPAHLTVLDGDVMTVQLIAPGHRCPSNALFDKALSVLPTAYLHMASASRAKPQSDSEDEASHFEAGGIAAEFGHEIDVRLLRRRNEARARADYPAFSPTAPTVLAFHKSTAEVDGHPTLPVEQHGSMPIDMLRPILSQHGLTLSLGTQVRRLVPRTYFRSSLDGMFP